MGRHLLGCNDETCYACHDCESVCDECVEVEKGGLSGYTRQENKE
jgi:NAD-dependent dihydropyrimidine dehydrogenase PreA subunit